MVKLGCRAGGGGVALATTVLAGESAAPITLLAYESDLGPPGPVVSLTWDACGAVLAGWRHLANSLAVNF